MANSYTQLYIHLIFTPAHRDCLIHSSFKEELHKYTTGIIQNKKNKLLAINSMPDHIHIFLGLFPGIAISDLVRDVKKSTSDYINDKKWLKSKFNWQEGYGAFSYSHSHIKAVHNYIMNQEKHHKKRTFREEYLDLLKKFEIKFDDKYLFKWLD